MRKPDFNKSPAFFYILKPIYGVTVNKNKRRFSSEWYEHRRNPFPHLKEYWYQQYVKAHPHEFGFTESEGPFDSGPDFIGVLDGRQVRIEVETDYVSYRQHGHPIFEVLIVGVLEPPLQSMASFLPPTIKNLDPQKVMDWSEPMRGVYRKEMEKRHDSRPKQLERIRENIDSIPAYRITKDERVEYSRKFVVKCACGEQMLEVDLSLDDFQEMTEGQMADYMAGFGRTFYCKSCGAVELLDGIQVPTFD